MKQIPLTKGYFALVDDEDFERVNVYKWQALTPLRKDGSIKNVYAQRSYRKDGKHSSEGMHRFIMGVNDSHVQVDHRDHNGLNNQKYNLRTATQTQNLANQRVSTKSASGFKGVWWSEPHKKWRAGIGVHGVQRFLGLFSKIEDAHKAYKTAAIEAFGEFAFTEGLNE